MKKWILAVVVPVYFVGSVALMQSTNWNWAYVMVLALGDIGWAFAMLDHYRFNRLKAKVAAKAKEIGK